MVTKIDTPLVFISYSWKPISNKLKTIALAERLESEGVHVIIDEWNLSEGQDKFQFMEQMVNNNEVKKVLLICNQEYAEKANKKSGGVGIESLIISDEIYSNADQTKFIPIIFERNNEGKEFVPTFIKTRIYIDLSNDEIFEFEYEKLMRNIFEKPATKRPPRGLPPSYIIKEDSIFIRTTHKVRAVKNALINENKNAEVFINDYYATFIAALEDFEISKEDLENKPDFDDIVISKIDEMKILRDDFISFLETILTYSTQFNIDRFLTFIENLLEFTMKKDSSKYPSRTIGSYMSDHYKFFYNELFLYIAAVMIEKEKFKELGKILNSGYVNFNQIQQKSEYNSFIIFNQHVDSLNKLRNKRLELRRIDLSADLIHKRADIPLYPFDKICEYDVLLYFISLMIKENGNYNSWKIWFPHTTVYNIYNLPLLERLISKRHFEKMKHLFNVSSIEELKLKVEAIIESKSDVVQRWDYVFPFINKAFDFEKIGTFN
jgi:hypothetical protein